MALVTPSSRGWYDGATIYARVLLGTISGPDVGSGQNRRSEI